MTLNLVELGTLERDATEAERAWDKKKSNNSLHIRFFKANLTAHVAARDNLRPFLGLVSQMGEALEKLHKVFDFEEPLDPGDFDIKNASFANAAFLEAYAALTAYRKAKGKK